MDLEALQRRIEQLEQAQNEVKSLKTVLEDALREDDRYQEVDLSLREMNMKKKQLKDEIWGQATYQEALAKLKDIKEEITDISDILNHELLQWRQEHNSDEIIGSDGTTRKLKVSVRLKPQYSKE